MVRDNIEVASEEGVMSCLSDKAVAGVDTFASIISRIDGSLGDIRELAGRGGGGDLISPMLLTQKEVVKASSILKQLERAGVVADTNQFRRAMDTITSQINQITAEMVNTAEIPADASVRISKLGVISGEMVDGVRKARSDSLFQCLAREQFR